MSVFINLDLIFIFLITSSFDKFVEKVELIPKTESPIFICGAFNVAVNLLKSIVKLLITSCKNWFITFWAESCPTISGFSMLPFIKRSPFNCAIVSK